MYDVWENLRVSLNTQQNSSINHSRFFYILIYMKEVM